MKSIIARLLSFHLAKSYFSDGLLVADLIIAERECCPFLRFELTAEPKMRALTIRITGPEGTKQFLRSILAMPQP
jgi:hypothetical protein